MSRNVLSILVKNNSGVLRRVSGLFSRRGYNIESLTVGVTNDASISRITVVVNGDEYIVDQIKKQLDKLVEVITVELLNTQTSVYRELLLVKVATNTQTRAQILEIVNIFRARVVDVSANGLILEATGDNNKLTALLDMLQPYGIREIARTGLCALQRGDVMLETEKTN